jgi:phosphatidylethanolamine/phosphatidyl-N-methylethanolamine N-methyltransferase
MAPLSRLLGWHPDFALHDLLDPQAVEVEAMEPCQPAGLFTLVRVRNPGRPPGQKVLARAA